MSYKFIEQAIDAWLLGYFDSRMGKSSDVTTLKLKRIEVANLRNQEDWKDWEIPALGIASRFAFRRPAGHGLGRLRLYRAVPYVLTFVVSAEEQNDARDKLLELFSRAEDAFRGISPADIGAITTESGERYRRLCYYASNEEGATEAERQAGMTRTRFYKNPKTPAVWGAGDYNVVFLTTTGE